jgi:hypothetical protein
MYELLVLKIRPSMLHDPPYVFPQMFIKTTISRTQPRTRQELPSLSDLNRIVFHQLIFANTFVKQLFREHQINLNPIRNHTRSGFLPQRHSAVRTNIRWQAFRVHGLPNCRVERDPACGGNQYICGVVIFLSWMIV